MASKTPSNHARTAAHENALIQERPCTGPRKCYGRMRIIVQSKGWKSMWQCPTCRYEQKKLKGDWTLKQARGPNS